MGFLIALQSERRKDYEKRMIIRECDTFGKGV